LKNFFLHKRIGHGLRAFRILDVAFRNLVHRTPISCQSLGTDRLISLCVTGGRWLRS
jgi:hypothetical protein